MDKIYAALIKKELKTIDDVPSNLREKVQAILDDQSN
ncbi:CD1375 family protein [Gracilibacillus oryzae]|nr:CD1375 family protein [Gracilibacillus oryzae]